MKNKIVTFLIIAVIVFPIVVIITYNSAFSKPSKAFTARTVVIKPTPTPALSVTPTPTLLPLSYDLGVSNTSASFTDPSPTSVPTDQPTPIQTASSDPTATPIPTNAPVPTNIPTDTPIPTKTVFPTLTPTLFISSDCVAVNETITTTNASLAVKGILPDGYGSLYYDTIVQALVKFPVQLVQECAPQFTITPTPQQPTVIPTVEISPIATSSAK